MVHIKNWESITDTNVDGIDVNSASIIYNPTLMDMLGLRCTPEKIYHISVQEISDLNLNLIYVAS